MWRAATRLRGCLVSIVPRYLYVGVLALWWLGGGEEWSRNNRGQRKRLMKVDAITKQHNH